jgi:hypothetical protein
MEMGMNDEVGWKRKGDVGWDGWEVRYMQVNVQT